MLLLKFAPETFFDENTEPDRFMHQYKGKIIDCDDKEERKAGKFSARVIDVRGAMFDGCDIFDVFDSEGGAMSCYENLYESDTEDFNEKTRDVAFGGDYPWNPNLLLLDRLVIYPEFRGKGLGLHAIRALIQRLRQGVGLVALKPFPLQFEVKASESTGYRKKGLHLFSLPEAEARRKLVEHYAKLGFREVPDTEFMVLNPEAKLPSPTELHP